MSEREVVVRFHDWRAATGPQGATHRRWRTRCIRLVVPASIGLVALVLAAATSSLCSRRLTVAQNFRTGR
jgi:hypothetical protein